MRLPDRRCFKLPRSSVVVVLAVLFLSTNLFGAPSPAVSASTVLASSCYISDNSIEFQVCNSTKKYIPAAIGGTYAGYSEHIFYIHKLSYQPYHISEWEASCIYWEGETARDCSVNWQVYALTWQWEPIYVSYDASTTEGTRGRLELYLDRTYSYDYTEASAWSFRDVVVVGPNAISITPASSSKTVQDNSSLSEEFTVRNTTPAPLTVNYSVSCTGTITDCYVSPSSVTLDSASYNSQESYPNISYNSGSTGGRITLTASYTIASIAGYDDSTFTKIGYYDITAQVPLTYNVSVTPYKTSLFQQALTPGTVKFKVQNTGNTAGTYTLTATCTGDVSSCSAPSSTTVSAGTYNDITVNFTAGQNFGTGQVKLKAVYSSYQSESSTGITNDPLAPRCQQ